MIKRKGNIYKLDTPSTTLIIDTSERTEYLYYGERLSVSGSDYGALKGCENGASLPLVSSFGTGDNRRPSVVCSVQDESFTQNFVFQRAKLTEKPNLSPLPSSYEPSDKKNAAQTLCLEFLDEPTKLKLSLYYTVYADSDVIAVSSRLYNGGKKTVKVKSLASLQLDLYGDDYSFVTFRGGWANERNKFVTKVNGGGQVCNESLIGSSSHAANPFVMLENDRGVYAFNLVYSGNHKESAECDLSGRTRVLVGVNDFMLDRKLAPGESFATPEAVMTFALTEDGVSEAMHDFVNNHIVRGKWKGKERPVLINNWEGTYFDFNREKILDMAERAAGLGVELFVLDDGWFGHRDMDNSSLGDWFDYKEKTGGIAALADGVREKGLKFGIWVEPEMISEDSELYKKHPEFAMKIPGREPTRMRNQLMLNLADPKVQKYIVRVISAVIADTKAAYVKWDYNRCFSDCYGKDVPSGEYFLRYTEGFYTVMRKITEKFPSVLFEGCAGGGGRFDLGVLCFMPQIWTSDDTDPRMRLAIQSGTSYGYPQSAMGAHVSASPNHQTGNISPIETRFNIAAFGAFGYELDPARLTDAESETVKKQIAFYKKYRKTLQSGKFYRLGDAFEEDVCGFIAVSENKSSAIATVAARNGKMGKNSVRVRFKGLDEATMYAVRYRKQDNYRENSHEKTMLLSGEILMKGGVLLDGFFEDISEEAHGNPIFTRMLVLEKAKNFQKNSADKALK